MKPKHKPKNSFHTIRRVMLVFGIFVKDSRCTRTRQDWRRYLIIISWVIQSLGVVYSFTYIAMVLPPYLNREVMYSFFGISILSNVTLLWKRKELEKAMHEVQKLSLSLNPCGVIGKKSINTSLFMYFLFLLGTFISVFVMQIQITEAAFGGFNFTFPKMHQEYEAIQSGKNFMQSMMTSKFAVYALNICFDICLIFCSAVFGLAIILMGNFYEALSNIIISEQKILQKKLLNHAQNPVNLLNEIETLQLISSTVETVDGVVNLSSLQLYALFFSGLFSIIGSLTSVFRNKTIMGNIIISAAIGGFLFLKFTKDACKVYEEGKQLKKVGLTYSRLSNNRDNHADLTLVVFLQNIKELNLYVTGGNMFVIERGLFLSIGSAMVTYGVLMYQLSGPTG